jgi:hypothetical protein
MLVGGGVMALNHTVCYESFPHVESIEGLRCSFSRAIIALRTGGHEEDCASMCLGMSYR